MSLEFLKPKESFQYSINLEYDLLDDSKVKGYLPTSGSISVLEELFNSIITKTSTRSRLMTGAYGKGKSHLTLTFLALISGRERKLFGNLLEKVKETNLNFYNNINQYFDAEKKLLPIIINTSSNDLKANLLNSLSIALKNNQMSSLMPTTFFDVAVDAILNWEKNFPETYKNFEKAVGYSGKDFRDCLANYEQEKYNLFVEVYPMLTSGSTFNPLQGTDVIKTYDAVIEQLSKFGYNGVYIAYDEFGKFLEGSLDSKTSAQDVKLLQDLAERCSRADLEKQLNLLLISHKGIDNYVGQLTKEKVDNWKAVAERFTKVTIQSKDSEIFEMIAQVLKKDGRQYRHFLNRHADKFAELESILRLDGTNTTKVGAASGTFAEIQQSIGLDFIADCYPLHPYSLFVLPKVSELVAQNERTIFTYLSANDKNTVSYFAKRTTADFPIIEPDAIYDYFEPAFKAEPFGSAIREQWQITNAAISKLMLVGNELAIKIVKTVALIYIIDQFELLPPSSDLIYEIYSLWGSVEVQIAFAIIKQEELLVELEFKPYIRIRKSSNNNISELIADEKAKLNFGFDIKQVLLDNMATQYFYPVEYNDRYEMTRFFKFLFLEYKEFCSINSIDEFIQNIDADGIIIAIIFSDDEERVSAIQKLKALKGRRTIYILPKDSRDISDSLKKYQAISNLIVKKSDDLLLVDELQYIQQDLKELIADYINKQFLKPEYKKTEYYYLGEKQEIRRRTDSSHLMSMICRNIFINTPTIINENVNRNVLSATMRNSRRKIIAGILSNELQPLLGLQGSQDLNVFRSIYVVPNIIADENAPIVDTLTCSARFADLFTLIRNFIVAANAVNRSFLELYELLVNPENGLGIKRGVIPFYLALVLREKKDKTVIYNKGREVDINEDLILAINDNPSLYQLRIENWDDGKEQYIFRLREIFSKHTSVRDMELSLFDYIMKAMQRWYFQLSKFQKETRQIFDENGMQFACETYIVKVRNALGNPEINAREFLFDKLPKIIDESNYTVITDKIRELKNQLDINNDNYLTNIIGYIRELFDANVNASLASTLADYFDTLTDKTKDHVFSGDAGVLLDIMQTTSNDDRKLVKELLKGFYSLRIEDFTDSLALSARGAIKKAKETIDKYNSDISAQTKESYCTIVFEESKGGSKKIQLDKMGEKSYQGSMFYNNITSVLDDFNEALSREEKGQIMIEVIKELLKQ